MKATLKDVNFAITRAARLFAMAFEFNAREHGGANFAATVCDPAVDLAEQTLNVAGLPGGAIRERAVDSGEYDSKALRRIIAEIAADVAAEATYDAETAALAADDADRCRYCDRIRPAGYVVTCGQSECQERAAADNKTHITPQWCDRTAACECPDCYAA